MILTRPAAESAALARTLRSSGHDVVELPCIAIEPLDDYNELSRDLADINARSRLVVTSRAGAVAVLRASGDRRIAAPIATVGGRAASVMREAGYDVDVEARTSEELAAKLPVPDGIVLLARSDRGLADLEVLLRRRGACVWDTVAYRTVARVEGDIARAEELIAGGAAVVFSSPSAFDALVERLGGEAALRTARLVATGPTTAQRVRTVTGRDDVCVTEWDRVAEVLS